jgi:tRNA threonylcarbamoyl adenosine modification protein YeaZ
MTASTAGTGTTMILAIDTATTRIGIATGVVGASGPDAIDADAVTDLRTTGWPAGYRHGETLLASIEAFLAEGAIPLQAVGAIAVGTGPGAFTGLRVGLATAKGLAHSLRCPIVGVSTGQAILAGAPPSAVLLLPAGPADRLVVRRGERAVLLPAGEQPDLGSDETIVAVDLPDRAPAEALELGETARAALGGWLIRLAADRLVAGDADDLAALVPEYVTLPRGVTSETGEVAWSHDRP